MSAEPTVVIADDHPVIRLGVRVALTRNGFSVVGEAADCETAVAAVMQREPDLCLLDVCMPGGGVAAAQRIARSEAQTAIVMLTVSGSSDDMLAALRAGAVGYLPKDMRPDRLAAALCGVLRGEAALPRALTARLLAKLRVESMTATITVGEVELTPRESEIIRMLRSGMSTIEIGRALSLSPITVRRHISSGIAKLGVADRSAAIAAIAPPAPLAEAG